MSPLATNPARGVLAVARAVLAQQPGIPLDELAGKLASSLGARKGDVRQILLESGLFAAPAVAEPEYDNYFVPDVSQIPRFVAVNAALGRSSEPLVYDLRPDDGSEGPKLVMHSIQVHQVQPVADGLNLGLSRHDALRRMFMIDELRLERGGATIRLDRPIDKDSRYVCDLLDQSRAWGPFPSAAAADAFRAADPALAQWALTTRWPYSRYFHPAVYGFFRQEAALNPTTDIAANDMTPEILAAVREYMAFNSETNRMYEPCREAYDRMRALLKAGAAADTSEAQS